eukprot:CAMPEP_0113641138 /NCGR_PEP_ID=MMETSP0017_2-20120614/21594_1 /TAXON_ID=2856 /ORGANISM="Cylindrotheca closterium" /LENGTH=160 /DNA_ID=CAMNT_0000552461 /DNA_START=99 /DNA_END=578 /DNA_ORIENTATION=+ /assembly_acc=CAM_ASM_000147
MVTQQNINFAITTFSTKNGGTLDNERAVTIGAIKGTLFGFLTILVISLLLAFWRQRNLKTMDVVLEMEEDDDYASLESISDDDDDDDDESQDTFIVSPTRYALRTHHQGTNELEMDSIGGYWEEERTTPSTLSSSNSHSSPRKSSLRVALLKHRGLGSGW